MQKLRPILGFGPIGWIATCILLAIIIAALCGYDFQFHYIMWIDKVFGQKFLFWYLYEIHIWHGFMWKDPMFGLIAAGSAVIALFIAPIGGRWWRYALVLAWGIGQPRLFIFVEHELWNAGAPGRLGLSIDSYGWMVLTGVVLNLLTCLMLWFVTRSKRVVATGVAASVLVVSYVFVVYMRTSTGYLFFPTIGPLDAVVGPFWNLAVGGALLWWAINARMRVKPEGACQHCGYDLRGTFHTRCPECGRSSSPQIPTTTANLVTDSPGT